MPAFAGVLHPSIHVYLSGSSHHDPSPTTLEVVVAVVEAVDKRRKDIKKTV
jgi:hypothetical protein